MLKYIMLLLITAILAMATLSPPITARAVNIFSVTPELPENQNVESVGSFNLDVKAGQTQEIEVLVANHYNDSITVEVSLINPGTSRNGVIDFSQAGNMDTTLNISFYDIAHLKVDPYITIPAGGTARVPIALQIPENGFDGVLFGAIRVLLGTSEEEMAQAGQPVESFEQVIPVRLFQDRNIVIAPEFKLGGIEFGLIAGVAAIEVNIRNPEPRFSMGTIVSAQIFSTDSDAPIFTITDLEVDFAPHSVYSLTLLDNAGFGILAGEYIANVQVGFDGQIWKFEQGFHITPADADTVNSNAINQQVPPQQLLGGTMLSSIILWLISIAAGITIILCIVIIVLVKAKRHSYPFRKELT
ncbi:MAG: DUF916 and DUF3324 domain-containing protein [Oscillospiraceae bacterium]|nr:DUF916 and DUF3324 domain-containing protein [Oscillospiraceae bacterium]